MCDPERSGFGPCGAYVALRRGAYVALMFGQSLASFLTLLIPAGESSFPVWVCFAFLVAAPSSQLPHSSYRPRTRGHVFGERPLLWILYICVVLPVSVRTFRTDLCRHMPPRTRGNRARCRAMLMLPCPRPHRLPRRYLIDGRMASCHPRAPTPLHPRAELAHRYLRVLVVSRSCFGSGCRSLARPRGLTCKHGQSMRHRNHGNSAAFAPERR